MQVALVISIFSVLSTISMAAPVSVEEQWNNFKSTFNKSYGTEEEPNRRAIFEANLKKIEEHNKQYEAGKVTWTMGVNQFTDLEPGEMKKFMGLLPPKNLATTS